MKTLSEATRHCDLELLSDQEMRECHGGGFAYDAGFFLREMWIYAYHGGNLPGTRAVAIDAAVNYRPR